jgi:hypothetical protein
MPKTYVITTEWASNCPFSVGLSPEIFARRPTTIASSAESADVLVVRNQELIQMNIRITALSFLIAATCGLSLTQAAHADDDEEKHIPSMRFEFAPNTYRTDHINPGGRAVSLAPAPKASVPSGSVPSNLFGLDPQLMSRATAIPVARPAVAQTQVSSKISSTSPFASLFNRPSSPLIAQGATPLAPIPWSPAKIHMPPASHTTMVAAGHPHGLRPSHHGQPVVAAKSKGGAPIASYESGKFYSQGDVRPGYSADGGTVTDASVSASLLNHKKH